MPTINLGEAEVVLRIAGKPSRPTIYELMNAKELQLLFKSHYR